MVVERKRDVRPQRRTWSFCCVSSPFWYSFAFLSLEKDIDGQNGWLEKWRLSIHRLWTVGTHVLPLNTEGKDKEYWSMLELAALRKWLPKKPQPQVEVSFYLYTRKAPAKVLHTWPHFHPPALILYTWLSSQHGFENLRKPLGEVTWALEENGVWCGPENKQKSTGSFRNSYPQEPNSWRAMWWHVAKRNSGIHSCDCCWTDNIKQHFWHTLYLDSKKNNDFKESKDGS